MKITRLMPCLILLLPLLVRADGPSTSPAGTAEVSGERFGFVAMPNRQEWNDMILFLQKNAPNRARVIDENDAWSNYHVRAELLKHWRDYRFVAEHFPEVGDLRVKRFQVEDVIFGLELQARHDPSVLESIRPQIRLQAAVLVHLSIEEHRLRIQKLQNLLKQEQERLSEEEGQEDAAVDRREQQIMDRIESELPKQEPAGPQAPVGPQVPVPTPAPAHP
jgi:hypothetical protein